MDGAAKFHEMYVEMCEACRRAGLPVPKPHAWVAMIEGLIAESLAALDPPLT